LLTGGKYGNIKIEMEMEMEMEISHFVRAAETHF